MSDHLNISDFLLPVHLHEISHHEGYKDGQLGQIITLNEEHFPDLDEANIVLVGCGEQRGSGLIHGQSVAPDIIRRYFYSLYYWHNDVKIADVGNIKPGSLYTDLLCCIKNSGAGADNGWKNSYHSRRVA
jgi:hypothetical protein